MILRLVLLLTLLFLPLSLFAQLINPLVAEIIGSIDIDTLTTFVSELSGVIPVTIADTAYTIASRYDTEDGNMMAAIYLSEKLYGYGLTPHFHDFSSSGRNVYAVQPGVVYPNQKYIICAHYDDVAPGGYPAPGADDNASGTAAVLEAARILSKYQTAYSIMYALWDKEEWGLVGSRNYANQAKARGDSIIGVINLDMIAWDSNDDMIMDIHTSSTDNSLELSDTVRFVNTTYNIGLTPVVKNPGSTASDHASFWANNYGAILLIESFADFNLYYHKTSDLLSAFNNTFFYKMSKLAIGTLAILADVQSPNGVVTSSQVPPDYILNQNYPNPFNPTTIIRYHLPTSSHVSLEVFDVLGRQVITLIDKTQSSGEYSVMWNASDCTNGVYICRFKAGNFYSTRKMILMK
jgi:hypothetical protein